MANPRSIAMKKLREREELARQAALLGAEKQKGIMSSLPTSLNNIGQFVSDDNNDLDDVSFSTLDGLKASFKNNRTKDSIPKIKVNPRVAAMTARKENLAMQKENTKTVASDNAKRFSALNSFIKTNSAETSQLDGNLVNKNTDLAVQAYERDNEIKKQKELARFKGDSSRIPPAGSVMQPRWDGSVDQNANFQMPTEGPEAVREAAIRTGMSQEDLDDLMLYQDQINSVTPDSMGPEGQEDTSEVYDPDAAFAYYPDGRPMSLEEYIGAGQADLMDSAEYKEEVDKKLFNLVPDWMGGNDYYINSSGYKDKNNQGTLAITDQNRADAISAILEDYNTRDIINFTETAKSNPEIYDKLLDGTLSLPAGRGDPFEGEDFTGIGFDGGDKNIDESSMTNLDQSLDGSNYDELLMEEGLSKDIDSNVDIEQGILENQVKTQSPIEIMDEQQNYEIPATPVEEVALEQQAVEAGVDLTNEQEVAEFKEEAEVQSASEELDAVDPSIKTTVDEVITTSQANGDSQEETESKLSELFGGLTDIFGVDNKSLLRAFVKYVGGRVFGLSSGKAAAFAWAGIEADMATESAKGAEARKYADNMAAYGTQYDAAMAAGDPEKANRILQKMNSESGIDKTDPEKYFEGLDFLQNKKAEAIAAGNTDLVKGIDAQIKRWEAGGIDGSASDPNYYDLMVQDKNGNRRSLLAKDGVNGREVKNSNGQWVPLSEWTDPNGQMGSITSNWRANKSDNQPDSFLVDTTAEDQESLIDADLEAGKITEEEAKGKRDKIIDSYTNPLTGEKYITKIPNAKTISPTGLVTFGSMNATETTSHQQLGATIRGYAKVDAILENPRSNARVNGLREWFATNMALKSEQPSVWRAEIEKKVGNPIQKAFYLGILEMTQARLRKETGAAYTLKELSDTMQLAPSSTDDSDGQLQRLKLDSLKDGIYQDAAGLGDSSGPYLVGVLEGYYRPNNAYAGMMNELYEMIDNDANYDDLDVILSSSGNSSQTTATNQDYKNAYMKE